MGRIEKAIVLSVLLGVILILAVSMDIGDEGTRVPDVPPAGGSTDVARKLEGGRDQVGPRRPNLEDERGQGSDPALGVVTPRDGRGTEAFDDGYAVEGDVDPVAYDGDAGAADDASRREPAAEGGSALLSSTIEQPGGARDDERRAAPRSTRAGIPADSVLVTVEGLEPTSDVALMRYRFRLGDSFASLADRFYGDPVYERLLERVNEEHASFGEGDEVLVPVYDRMGLGAAPTPTPGATPTVPADGVYVVREGDSLWTISRKTLGKGSRWKEIHQLNMDQLPSADAVRPGMVLRLPAH